VNFYECNMALNCAMNLAIFQNYAIFPLFDHHIWHWSTFDTISSFLFTFSLLLDLIVATGNNSMAWEYLLLLSLVYLLIGINPCLRKGQF